MPSTRQPLRSANCATSEPTAPAAPDTTTTSPALGRSDSIRPNHAVRPGIPSTPMAVLGARASDPAYAGPNDGRGRAFANPTCLPPSPGRASCVPVAESVAPSSRYAFVRRAYLSATDPLVAPPRAVASQHLKRQHKLVLSTPCTPKPTRKSHGEHHWQPVHNL